MYTFKNDPHNHRVAIMNTVTKRGVTLAGVGDEMAKFLKELVFQANKHEIEGGGEAETDHCKCYFVDVPMSLDTDGNCEHCGKPPYKPY